MKIKRVQKKVTTIYVWSCCALQLLFVLSLLVLSLSLSVSFSLSKFLHLSLTLHVCDHVGAPVNLPNNFVDIEKRALMPAWNTRVRLPTHGRRPLHI